MPHDLRPFFDQQIKHHAIILLDAEGRVVEWLPGAESLLGYAAEEMLGGTLERLFTPEDRVLGQPAHELVVAAASNTADDDRWHVCKDNRRIWISGILTALRDDDGNVAGFGKIMRDRTDLRTQLDTLQNRIDSLVHAERQRNIFLGTLAHELRNPLGPLSNATHLLQMRSGDNTESSYATKLIERQVRFIEHLVEDLLDVTRIGANKVKLTYDLIELGALIEEARETCEPQLAGRDLNVTVMLPSQIRFEGDGVRLKQVLVNLISNSAKFTPAGGSIWIEGTIEGPEVVVRVEDTGKGIPKDLLPYIFDFFSQAELPDRRERMTGGLGLGLALVKSFVELHGGTIQARSNGVGKGAEFVVRLPLKHDQRTTHRGK